MSSRALRLVTSALALLAVLGCAKRTDYLYFYNPDKPISFEHKVKELNGKAELDILWVIDNSGSMSSNQAKVMRSMDQFINGLVTAKKLPWKMGLISTTYTDDPYVGFRQGDLLDNTSTDAVVRFNEAVAHLGTSGDAWEKEYDPIVKALTDFPDFLRPTAYLAIIVVSDAPEQSSRSTQEFIQDITKLKGNLSDVFVYAFVNPTDWCPIASDDAFGWQGSKIEELLRQVKGEAYKLCDPDFEKKVADLGSLVAKQVTTPRIDLTEKPIISTIKVIHKDKELPAGLPPSGYWTYDVRMNSIVFSDLSFAPNPNEAVRVTYSVDQNK